jgi:Flp pilus assembly pilin Flp
MPGLFYRILSDRTATTVTIQHGLLAGLIVVAIIVAMTVIRRNSALLALHVNATAAARG